MATGRNSTETERVNIQAQVVTDINQWKQK